MADAGSAASGDREPTGVAEVDGEEAPGQPLLKPLGVVAFVLIGCGAVLAGLAYGAGSLDRPGPGTWPVTLGAALALSAVAFLLANRDGKEGAFGGEVRSALVVIGSVVVFVLLFAHVSFLLASVVLLAGCQLAAGATRWLTIATTCVVGTGAAWVLFFLVLGVTTPL